jgi:hypothetical protein
VRREEVVRRGEEMRGEKKDGEKREGKRRQYTLQHGFYSTYLER